MAKQLAKQSKGGFTGNTKGNPKNENYSAIELWNKKGFDASSSKGSKEEW